MECTLDNLMRVVGEPKRRAHSAKTSFYVPRLGSPLPLILLGKVKSLRESFEYGNL
jgi:hypothetical protein